VRHTRRSLDEAANQVAHALAVEPGTRVGIYWRNRTEYVEALLGCWNAGAAPVNINWRYTLDELPYVSDDAELEVMIVEDEYVPMVEQLAIRRAIRVGEWVGADTTRAGLDAIRVRQRAT
jgi:acyl-CoA synthetase (AMP-forming)/AMP-acid ligase II